ALTAPPRYCDRVTALASNASSFVRRAYELGARRSTGSLYVAFDRAAIIGIVEGAVRVQPDDPLGRRMAMYLSRLAELDAAISFRRTTAGPCHGAAPTLPLTVWARRHTERALDLVRAGVIEATLGARKLRLRPGSEVAASCLDTADHRVLGALANG